MNSYKFDLPQNIRNSLIKVIGVGGGGSNAVTNMFNRGIKDVDFIVCNTDAQALEGSPVATRLQIGVNLTEGLGAGANPEVGKNAAIESKDDIKALLEDGTKMLFVTAGMGGGTGTGGAPVIANIAKKMGILTVGIVTLPFGFEGNKKRKRAEEGIKDLKEHCDTVLVILNDRLKEVLGNLSIGMAFAQADNVLTTAAKSIAEIITVPGYVNVDFEDVKTVMKDAGAAVMGSGVAEGENRAINAAKEALTSPLLDYKDIHGAQKILLSIVSGPESELQMDELTEITDYIQEQVGIDSELIFGHGSDDQLSEKIRVTVIATGFKEITEEYIDKKDNAKEKNKYLLMDASNISQNIRRKKVNILNENQGDLFKDEKRKQLQKSLTNNKEFIEAKSADNDLKDKMKIPAFMRKNIILETAEEENSNLKKVDLYDHEESND
ncbi:MAG: cell division protein FtsZ [Bacteroidetes bacterium]|nr:cell division protein FtsZ [Bacteroidota bacterium]